MDRQSNDLDYVNLLKTLRIANKSCCKKRKVGALVTNGNLFTIGFNHGTTEQCNCSLHTKNPNVIHAEQHALSQINNPDVIYVSYRPCENCQKLIVKSDISKVVTFGDFDSDYLSDNGVQIVCYNF